MVAKLFDNSWETNATSAIGLIEQALRSLGHDPDTSELDDPATVRTWQVLQGSAAVTVCLRRHADAPHLRVSAAVMTPAADSDRAALHADLLARNLELCGMAFALHGEQVLLVSERSTRDLDRSEVIHVIADLARHADGVDDALVAQHGGLLG